LSSRLEGNVSRLAGAFAELPHIARRSQMIAESTVICDSHLAPLVKRLSRDGSFTVVPIRRSRTKSSFWRCLCDGAANRVLVSPSVNAIPGECEENLVIRVAAAWADSIHLPWIRDSSGLVAGLLSFLHDAIPRLERPEVFAYRPFVPNHFADLLRSHGARISETGRSSPDAASESVKYAWPDATDIVRRTADLIRGRPGLIHCVRGTAGLSLSELSDEHLDALLTGAAVGSQSPVDVLEHIARCAGIHSSSRAIRGGADVACFTARPLHRVGELHRFRPSRRRWDFLPFGIWIEQSWLEERGARPVIYGGDATWENLAPSQHPWFQPVGATPATDWRVEEEWRVVGDLDLETIPSDQIFFFVSTKADADRLQKTSRWPVVDFSLVIFD
jgi:hypothetical protein